MLWEIDIHPLANMPDRAAQEAITAATEAGLGHGLAVRAARGFLVESDSLDAAQAGRLATELFADPTVERSVVATLPADELLASADADASAVLLQVVLKPGVMDPVAQSAEGAIHDFGFSVEVVRTLRKYWVSGATPDQITALSERVLANDAIEQVVVGPLPFTRLQMGSEYSSNSAPCSLPASMTRHSCG